MKENLDLKSNKGHIENIWISDLPEGLKPDFKIDSISNLSEIKLDDYDVYHIHFDNSNICSEWNEAKDNIINNIENILMKKWTKKKLKSEIEASKRIWKILSKEQLEIRRKELHNERSNKFEHNDRDKKREENLFSTYSALEKSTIAEEIEKRKDSRFKWIENFKDYKTIYNILLDIKNRYIEPLSVNIFLFEDKKPNEEKIQNFKDYLIRTIEEILTTNEDIEGAIEAIDIVQEKINRFADELKSTLRWVQENPEWKGKILNIISQTISSAQISTQKHKQYNPKFKYIELIEWNSWYSEKSQDIIFNLNDAGKTIKKLNIVS